MWDLRTLNRLNAEAEQRTRELSKRRIAWENAFHESPVQPHEEENLPRYPEGDINDWRDSELTLAINRTIADLEAQC
jgi:hypothetical protein